MRQTTTSPKRLVIAAVFKEYQAAQAELMKVSADAASARASWVYREELAGFSKGEEVLTFDATECADVMKRYEQHINNAHKTVNEWEAALFAAIDEALHD